MPASLVRSTSFSPLFAISSSGREIDWDVLFYGVWDLLQWGWIGAWEYEEQMFWLRSYRGGGAMPGFRRFRCVWSNEYQLFTTWMDGIWEMYIAAMNDSDVTDDEEADDRMMELLETTNPEDYDLLYPWPVNIGRFGLLPTTLENRPPNVQ